MDGQEFLSRFRFDPKGRGLFGVEIEYFLAHPGEDFRPAPNALTFLRGMDSVWGYELSACQVEYHTRPASGWKALTDDLEEGRKAGDRRAAEIRRRLVAYELAPYDMPLDVYPEDERYARIAANLPVETLRAACRVAATHIHRGAGSFEEALAIHNQLAAHLDSFVVLGNHSGGERIRLYKIMAPNWKPPYYESAEHFCRVASEQGFEKDPRSCWHLVRINPKGTVEVRTFGTTGDIDEIISWAKEIRKLL